LNFTLLACLFSTLLLISFMLNLYIAQVRLIKRDIEEKALAIDYIVVVNALSYASKKTTNASEFSALFSYAINYSISLLKKNSDYSGELTSTEVYYNTSPGSCSAYAKAIFTHPWGNETIHALLSIKVTTYERYSLPFLRHYEVVLLKVQVKSERPVDLSFKVKNGSIIEIKRYPDQIFLIKALVRRRRPFILIVNDERGIELKVKLDGNN